MGPKHASVATSYKNVAAVLHNQSDLKQAKEYHKRAVHIRLQKLGPQNPDVATSNNNFVVVLHDHGDLKKAKEYHECDLAIRLKMLVL